MWTPDKGKVREEVRKRVAVLLCGRSLHFSGMDDWDKCVCVCVPLPYSVIVFLYASTETTGSR